MPEYIYKEVYFHQYCKQCEYRDLDETESPCFECLEDPVNAYSHKPVKFKERED